VSTEKRSPLKRTAGTGHHGISQALVNAKAAARALFIVVTRSPPPFGENGINIFRQPSNHANGNTRDRQGRLITCEHSGRRITRTEYDGTIAVLIDRFDGKRLNGTNDVVVKSDDSIWFTDPPSGISGNYLGVEAKPELPFDVYRLDLKTGRATVATTGLVKRPNGLAFSPDESKLYVIESAPEGRSIYFFDVVDGGAKLANGRIFIDCEKEETPDGFSGRCRRQFVVWLGHEPGTRGR
jgi:gluconolactonase